MAIQVVGARLRNSSLCSEKLRLRPMNREEMLRICIRNLPMVLGSLAPCTDLTGFLYNPIFILAVLRTAGHPLPPESSVYIDF